MQSHRYEFSAKDLAARVALPVLPLAVFAVLMHGGAALGLLPEPRPTLDTDRTIVLHQAEASRQRHSAELVCIGDSSCLMDVSARELENTLHIGALNLGTLSYLDLRSFANILQHYVAANPHRLRTVVALLHPESLRRAAPIQSHVERLNDFYERRDPCEGDGAELMCLLGIETFRGRIFARTPVCLSGSLGDAYGFTTDLWNWMSLENGSLVAPGRFIARAGQGNAEYQLSKSLDSASRDFKATVPPNARVIIGITPSPRSFVRADHAQRCQAMLAQWAEWMGADATLTNLPSTLPDDMFASTTHLNETGARMFTEVLARELRNQLR
jgi:hypothetical protein